MMDYKKGSTRTELIIGRMREKQFMHILEKIMKKHQDWEIIINLVKKNWFFTTWELKTNTPYNMTNLLFLLDKDL